LKFHFELRFYISMKKVCYYFATERLLIPIPLRPAGVCISYFLVTTCCNSTRCSERILLVSLGVQVLEILPSADYKNYFKLIFHNYTNNIQQTEQIIQ
jgi:hypothetical protein